jgi:hypothetical protein
MPRIPATWGEKIEALQVLGLIQHHPKKKKEKFRDRYTQGEQI